MPSEVLTPLSKACPATGQGGSACDSSTLTTADCDTLDNCEGSLKKDSCQWHNFESPSLQPDWDDATLSVGWIIRAAAKIGCAISNRVDLQYSLNGGSSWSSFSGFPKDSTLSQQSGTATKALSVGQTISNVRVRIVVQSLGLTPCPPGPGGAFCETDADVTGIDITATYQTGACCVGGSCSVKAASQCAGAYQGDGTDCSPNPCTTPTGACCTGSSCAVTTQAACGGVYQGDGTDCTPNPCEDTGACCVGTACSITTQSACGGTWQGAGTVCHDGSCVVATGACCTGSECNPGVTQSNCNTIGGIYQGNSSTCSPDPCPHNEPPVIVM